MLGGMSGGGMGFIFDPAIRDEAQAWLQTMMLEVKQSMQDSVPFAMDPVVYDFEINDKGTFCGLNRSGDMPRGYRALVVPDLLKADFNTLSPMTRREIERAGDVCRDGGGDSDFAMRMINRILPCSVNDSESADTLQTLLKQNGFDPVGHEQLREELTFGRLGLAQNRLAATVRIQDVSDDDVTDARGEVDSSVVELGRKAISEGQAGVVTLAAGVGSRWTQGAGVVKALNMFCRMDGEFRSFLDIHLAKTRRTASQFGSAAPHVIRTGYMTDPAIRRFVEERYASGNVYVSKGASVGLRMIPTVRDLQFAWEEMPQQLLDEQQEKMRTSVRAALMNWARSSGEASSASE